MSKKKVKDIVDNAQDAVLERPQPLMRELPPAAPFPVKALGKMLGEAAKAVHDKTQAPMAICGQSVLATAALAVQGYANVTLPNGQSKPTSCFFLSIAESGERKTACDAEALQPVKTREMTLREKFDTESFHYTNEKEIWEKARKKVMQNNEQGAVVDYHFG